MEALVEQLSKLLEISVQQATIAYPILRDQYIWYSILSPLIFILVMGAVIGCLGCIGATIVFMEVKDNVKFKDADTPYAETKYFDYTQARSLLKLAITIEGVVIALMFIATTLQSVMAKDIVMLKEFL